MRSVNGDGSVDWDAQDSGAQEEKIFVAVRLRPLNEKELGRNHVPDWDCINKTTLVYRNAQQERPSTPTAYTFDRVFGGGCSTRQVYEEAAKKIALSVLSGINSTIFAYGQTSSGKTYTMSGITTCAVADIYDYINKHPERVFMLKFSALEIYNEQVKDLLCPNGSPLRLLDDPERGTVVGKLTEVTLRDLDHLHELLSACEAQRQTGETSLNEVSSRSHQILRLTIESEARQYYVAEKAGVLSATVNFVDLAGSERASQTRSRGSRLKEGSHINRSLLTLGTVIRKLSKGRNAHVPYRDSKLTRILQNSLGGNARTAIICTLSPARCHVEQSKNTLVFASCAKQVTTNAQVNVAISDKMMVKQLQNELNRLENELRNLRSLSALSVSESALKEKEMLLEKMEKEIQELTHQRDLAFSRVESMLRSGASSQASKSSVDTSNVDKASDESLTPETSEIYDPHRSNATLSSIGQSYDFDGLVSSKSEDQFAENNEEQFFSGNISPTQYIDKYFGPDPYTTWEKLAQEKSKKFEDTCKEVQCIDTDSTAADLVPNSPPRHNSDHASELSPCSPDNNASHPYVHVSRSSSSCEDMLTKIVESPCTGNKNTMDNEADNQEDLCTVETASNTENVCMEDSQTAIESDCIDEEDQNIDTLGEDYVDMKEEACVKEVKEVILPKLVNQIESNMETDPYIVEQSSLIFKDMEEEEEETLKGKTTPEEASDVGTIKTPEKTQCATYWSNELEEKMKEIISLWDTFHVPLVHRTYFFLLFKGDPLDVVYVEVELRRLLSLKNSINGAAKDVPSLTDETSRVKALNRERQMLSRRMLKKYSSKEREELYWKWGVDVRSKQRRVQLCQKLWTDTTNMDHISASAAIVAKLVGFKDPGEVTTEMFGLSLLPNPSTGGFFSWTHSLLPSMM